MLLHFISSVYWHSCCCCLVTKLCLTLCNPMDYSPLGSSVHDILQARILEWVAISFSKGSCWPRDRIHIACIAGRFLPLSHQGSPILTLPSKEKKWMFRLSVILFYLFIYFRLSVILFYLLIYFRLNVILKINKTGTSLVVQWLRIHLPTQGMWVQSLVSELRLHMPRGTWACVLQWKIPGANTAK